MQTIEACLSLLVFLSIAFPIISAISPPGAPDDSLYRMQLAEDAWRVMYLRGDFQDFGLTGSRDRLEVDLSDIGNQTSLCFYLGGIRSSNCRHGPSHDDVFKAVHTVIRADGRPGNVTFSMMN